MNMGRDGDALSESSIPPTPQTINPPLDITPLYNPLMHPSIPPKTPSIHLSLLCMASESQIVSSCCLSCQYHNLVKLLPGIRLITEALLLQQALSDGQSFRQSELRSFLESGLSSLIVDGLPGF